MATAKKAQKTNPIVLILLLLLVVAGGAGYLVYQESEESSPEVDRVIRYANFAQTKTKPHKPLSASFEGGAQGFASDPAYRAFEKTFSVKAFSVKIGGKIPGVLFFPADFQGDVKAAADKLSGYRITVRDRQDQPKAYYFFITDALNLILQKEAEDEMRVKYEYAIWKLIEKYKN